MKILIFGSTGFLGQNFMYHKSNKDHEILSPDRDKLDLFDKKKVFDYIRLNKPDLIPIKKFHEARLLKGIQLKSKRQLSRSRLNLNCV